MNDIANCNVENKVDGNNNPTGGFVRGCGLVIEWQNGPLGRDTERKEPNGAFVETIISAAIQRLMFYQTANRGKFYCAENADAIHFLMQASHVLQTRTARREAAGTEGTHKW